MLCLIRPSFEVVKEGRIWKKIKHLEREFVGFFVWCQFGARIWTKIKSFHLISGSQIKRNLTSAFAWRNFDTREKAKSALIVPFGYVLFNFSVFTDESDVNQNCTKRLISDDQLFKKILPSPWIYKTSLI
jgi:hypothetical protein